MTINYIYQHKTIIYKKTIPQSTSLGLVVRDSYHKNAHRAHWFPSNNYNVGSKYICLNNTSHCQGRCHGRPTTHTHAHTYQIRYTFYKALTFMGVWSGALMNTAKCAQVTITCIHVPSLYDIM